jgi:hypothetical protein
MEVFYVDGLGIMEGNLLPWRKGEETFSQEGVCEPKFGRFRSSSYLAKCMHPKRIRKCVYLILKP